MTAFLTKTQTPARLDLEELFEEAARYGLLSMFQFDNGEYHLRIKFTTVQHVTLEAESGRSATLKEALVRAIAKAEQIKAQFR